MIRDRDRARAAARWHRRIGIAAMLPLILVAITGIVLDHAADLTLDERHIAAGWLTSWYGLEPREAPRGAEAEGAWLVSIEDALYLGSERIAPDFGKILGAVKTGGVLAAASPETLLLLTPEGLIVERLPSSLLGGAITRIGSGEEGRLVVETEPGRLAFDETATDWGPTDAPAHWASAAAPPAPAAEAALAGYRGAGLTLERVILDLHSFRILGPAGPYLMDLAGLALLLVGGTGLYYLIRRPQNGTRSRQGTGRRPRPPE